MLPLVPSQPTVPSWPQCGSLAAAPRGPGPGRRSDHGARWHPAAGTHHARTMASHGYCSNVTNTRSWQNWNDPRDEWQWARARFTVPCFGPAEPEPDWQ
eukprot:768091-Hanusia_phi.AAC.3